MHSCICTSETSPFVYPKIILKNTMQVISGLVTRGQLLSNSKPSIAVIWMNMVVFLFKYSVPVQGVRGANRCGMILKIAALRPYCTIQLS